jgi:cytochrome c5
MKATPTCLFAASAMLILPALPSFADGDGNWKRGRIYYRAACTSCHTAEIGESISPASKKIAEWETWIETPEGAEHLAEYVSQDYRASIAPDNKVAEKFAPIANEDLWADIRAFVVYGAADSATPATCN